MKALVGPFNQEKALVGAFSVIVKTDCETDGSSAARLLAHPQKLYSRVLHSTAKQMQSAIYFFGILKVSQYTKGIKSTSLHVNLR